MIVAGTEGPVLKSPIGPVGPVAPVSPVGPVAPAAPVPIASQAGTATVPTFW